MGVETIALMIIGNRLTIWLIVSLGASFFVVLLTDGIMCPTTISAYDRSKINVCGIMARRGRLKAVVRFLHRSFLWYNFTESCVSFSLASV